MTLFAIIWGIQIKSVYFEKKIKIKYLKSLYILMYF